MYKTQIEIFRENENIERKSKETNSGFNERKKNDEKTLSEQGH